MNAKIEIVQFEDGNYGVLINDKVADRGFTDFEAKACKAQLEMLDDCFEDIMEELEET